MVFARLRGWVSSLRGNADGCRGVMNRLWVAFLPVGWVAAIVLGILLINIYQQESSKKVAVPNAAPAPVPPITVTGSIKVEGTSPSAPVTKEVIKEVVPPDILKELDDLKSKNLRIEREIADLRKMPTPVITQAAVVGTITSRQALDLIKDSSPKTSGPNGMRAVEFNEADLVSESVFKAWLAQDKTEDEALGDSWDYITALEYKLRQQPGGKNIPFNRARMGRQTLAAVILYDSTDKLPRLYVFSPHDEKGIKKLNPLNPDQIIEYVHLD